MDETDDVIDAVTVEAAVTVAEKEVEGVEVGVDAAVTDDDGVIVADALPLAEELGVSCDVTMHTSAPTMIKHRNWRMMSKWTGAHRYLNYNLSIV